MNNFNKNMIKIIDNSYMINIYDLFNLDLYKNLSDYKELKILNNTFYKYAINALFTHYIDFNVFFYIDKDVINNNKSLLYSIVDDGFKKVFYNDRFLKTDAIKIHSIDNIIISKGLNIDITPLDNSYSILDYKD